MATSSMATSSSAATSTASSSLDDYKKPLWRFVKKFDTLGGGGGVDWQCNFCGTRKKTSYTRVVNHLLGLHKGIAPCLKVTEKDKIEMKKLMDEESRRQMMAAPKSVPLPPNPIQSKNASSDLYATYNRLDLESQSKKRKGSGEGSSALEKCFNVQGRKHLDALIARYFYASGLPFHLARSPYYASSYTYAASHNLAGYVPPGYNALRTTLLEQERANVEHLLLPIKSTWGTKGVSIVSDGWSDSQRRPLINFMVVTEGGPMFLKAIDCSGEVKDKHFIFGLMKQVIEEVGVQNVVQVITDNAKNCSSAGSLIEAEFPTIVWTPCVVHTLNLALQNICAAKNIERHQETYELCSWITDISAEVSTIKNYIMNHGMRLAMFNKFVPLKLLSIATTRFASVIVMLRRFKLIKRSLLELVISEAWDSYREDDTEKASFVKAKVLEDTWWDKIDYILSFTAPIYDMLRACDTDKPCLHLVYDMWDSMIEKVKKAIYKHERIGPEESSNFYEVVHTILVSRWNKSNTPLHCLAHSLNPKYYSQKWLDEDSSRVAPNMDIEIARERMKCLRKYFPDTTLRKVVNKEFGYFSSMSGDFADSDSIEERYDAEPQTWWSTYGAGAPNLQRFAMKILAQPASSSCAERNWSTYSFIHSLRRNKLTTKRAEALVFIHSNLRLLSRRTPEYINGNAKLWDIGGDDFGTFEDVGELEFANLSLDEPELESVLFNEDQDAINEDEMELEEDDE